MNEKINELAVKHLTLTYNGASRSLILDGLDKFIVELIRAEEREACAKLIEEMAIEFAGRSDLTQQQCVRAIRARDKVK